MVKALLVFFEYSPDRSGYELARFGIVAQLSRLNLPISVAGRYKSSSILKYLLARVSKTFELEIIGWLPII